MPLSAANSATNVLPLAVGVQTSKLLSLKSPASMLFVWLGRSSVMPFLSKNACIFVGTIILIAGVWLEDRKLNQAESESASLTEAETPLNIEEIQGE